MRTLTLLSSSTTSIKEALQGLVNLVALDEVDDIIVDIVRR